MRNDAQYLFKMAGENVKIGVILTIEESDGITYIGRLWKFYGWIGNHSKRERRAGCGV